MIPVKLKEIIIVFFKLGCTAFGGPAVHIAMMEKEIVEKRKWMTHDHFLDLIGATNLIPGPNSTEMTMHCGHERGGKAGLILAGISFILPATLITGAFAWLYAAYGTFPDAKPFIDGIKPVVLSIILYALIKLAGRALRNFELILLAVLVLVLALLGINEILLLFMAGFLGTVYFNQVKKMNTKKGLLILLIPVLKVVPVKLTGMKLFFTFLKIGAILYGSGYVLFAYLDAELVSNGWLTRKELMDAVAVGQFTPGPVLSTATFIGYQISGFWGALLATTGIFLPSFLFVLLLNPIIPKLRKSKWMNFFLDAVNAASIALIASVLIQMGTETLTGWKEIVLCTVAVVITFSFKKLNPAFVIIGGGIVGYLLF